MHVSRKRRFIFLIAIITITTLPAVGWCKPTGHPRPGPKVARRDGGSGGVKPAGRARPPEPVAVSTEASNIRSAHSTVFPAADKRLKIRNKAMRRNPGKPETDACRAGTVTEVLRGRFYVTGQMVANQPLYQADSAESVGDQEDQMRIRGQKLRGTEESWRRLQPAVECGDDAMTLTVKRRQAVQLLLDRANESSVPLSQLPPHCGYSVQTTWRELSLVAQYDACHVTQEVGDYVLPLLWRGAAVKMSCPVSRMQPQLVAPGSLCCFPHGMSIRLQSLTAAQLKVKVRGEWTPLLDLAQQCGYTMETRADEILIAAPFVSCGITVEDGKHTLSFQTGEKVLVLACLISASEESPPTLNHQPTSAAIQPTMQTSEPFRWAPPFYLAPLHYPHPTYHHKGPDRGINPSPDPAPDPRPDPGPSPHLDYPPLTPVPSIPYLPFGQQPLPPVDLLPEHQNPHSHQIPAGEPYKHFGINSALTSTDEMLAPGGMESHSRGPPEQPDTTGFHIQVPSLHPSSHTFNPYYHYYHHPKIPRPGSAGNPDPGHKVSPDLSLTLPYQRQPAPEDPSPATVSSIHPAPYPPQPHPQDHYSYYGPLVARGESEDVETPNHNTDPSVNHPAARPSSPPAYNEYDLNPNVVEPNAQKDLTVEWTQHPLLYADMEGEVNDGQRDSASAGAPHLEQPSLNSPLSVHNPSHYADFYHPYHFYQMYHPSLSAADNSAPQIPNQEALYPLLPASPESPQPPPELKLPPLHHDVQSAPRQPFYDNYQFFHQPRVSEDKQVMHAGGGGGESEKQATKPEPRPPFDFDGWGGHTAETGSPSVPQPLLGPLRNCHHPPLLNEHFLDSFEHPVGENTQDGHNDDGRDHPEANPYTPPASPCSLGPDSDFHCSVSFGCCSYPVKDCTVVTEPILPPPAHPTEVSNVSCTLQRLTTDPDIYIVPMDGCGLSKHEAGHTEIHPSEVQHEHISGYENTPVRMTVECSSSPHSPGDLRFHVAIQTPLLESNPATVTAQLKIATDEAFARFHPEAHLPLSLVQGRPLYLEARLLDPLGPSLKLLVHACMAHTRAVHSSWILIYDGCRSWGDSQLLPPPHSNPHHIRRIRISSFLPLPLGSSSYMTTGEVLYLDDPEIYFLCLIEVCSATDSLCTLGCSNNPNSGTR